NTINSVSQYAFSLINGHISMANSITFGIVIRYGGWIYNNTLDLVVLITREIACVLLLKAASSSGAIADYCGAPVASASATQRDPGYMGRILPHTRVGAQMTTLPQEVDRAMSMSGPTEPVLIWSTCLFEDWMPQNTSGN